MTNEEFATYANYALASAVVLFTLAMLGYALYLAQAVPAREQARSRVSAGVPASVGAPGDASDHGDEPPADAPVETSLRARQSAGIAGSFTWLATGLLALSALLRGLAVDRFPLSNLFEFSVFGAFFASLTMLVVGLKRDTRWLGVFVTGFNVLLLLIASTAWYVEADEVVPSLQSYWLPIHVTIATMAVGICVVGALISALYLLSDSRAIKPAIWDRFPAAEQLERLSYRLHIIAFPMWTFTIIFGAIWAREAWGAYWNWDPKEVWSFVIWVVYAAYLHARATKNTSRRTANWIAIAGFVCIVLNYTVVNFYFIGQHSYAQ